MRFSIGRVVAGNICMLLIIGTPREVAADETLAKRFFEEAPRKWQEYKSLFRGFDQQYDTLTEYISKKTKDHAAGRFVCGTDGARAWTEGWQKRADQRETAIVNGSNPDYDFELRKSAGSEGSFSIHSMTPRRKSDKVGIALSSVASQAGEICFAYPLHFDRFISSPDFHVKNATEVVRDGDRLVQIEFSYHLKNPRPDEKFLVGQYTGTVCFAPDSYWAITEAKLKMHDDPFKEVGAIDIHNKIAKALRSIPVIVETRILWYDLKGDLVKRLTRKREWKEYIGGDERFTLSAYGFPEPTLSRPSKKRFWILGILVALPLLFVALFIYRRWRRA